jgi:hypothetical protein
MPITPAEDLPEPPKPFGPNVRIVEADGRPTREFHLYLTRLYEWLHKLRTVLTA